MGYSAFRKVTKFLTFSITLKMLNWSLPNFEFGCRLQNIFFNWSNHCWKFIKMSFIDHRKRTLEKFSLWLHYLNIWLIFILFPNIIFSANWHVLYYLKYLYVLQQTTWFWIFFPFIVNLGFKWNIKLTTNITECKYKILATIVLFQQLVL